MARAAIPHTTVSRLPLYLRCLDQLPANQETVSSREIAGALNIKSAKVRKDFWYLDCEGRRGVGYDVQSLVSQIGAALGLNVPLNIVIIGMGNLGMALAHYQGFANRGLTLAGLYDTDPDKIGKSVGGIVIRHPNINWPRTWPNRGFPSGLSPLRPRPHREWLNGWWRWG